MNRFYKFPKNEPPKIIMFYWDEKEESWEVWFPEDQEHPAPPMFDGGEFEPWKKPYFTYEKVDYDE